MDKDAVQALAAASNAMGQRSQLPNDSGATTSTVVADALNGFGKARKTYTITKQRERWSEEEHLRFIEALRLHGRAWRKIEEHIGTKTAVQIRSHAQKFFNKLEKKKEAGEAPDKEENFTIPPPRPKRKPAKPYPRKDGVTSSGYTGTSQLSPQLHALPQQLPPGVAGLSLGPAAAGVVAATAAAGGGGSHHMRFLNGLAAATAPEQGASSSEVTDATVAAVTAAASAAAAAAAAAVVAAAGQEVQTHMQVHPPSCFPFFGLPPSVLAQITPHGSTTLDQAALLTQHIAAAKAAAALREVDAAAAVMAGVAPAGRGAAAGANVSPGRGADMGLLGNGSDRGLVEATGTTDGTHISANAQLRGSDGDSACSRETDNQDTPGVAMDASWQSNLLHQTLQQHEMNSTNPAAAARGLAAQQASGFDPSQLQWGMGRCYGGSAQALKLAAAGLPGLQGLSAAQALAVLCTPLYAAAAERQYQHQSALEAAAVAAAHPGGMAAAGKRGGAGVAASSGDRGAGGGLSGRSKSWRTAPSVNSGSTGLPLGAKRALEAGSEGCVPAKKAACGLSGTGEEPDCMMEASPSSPSVEEKELKESSQPSGTNGNTCGSNESDASKRHQGTAQGEGSNPTNGNSSGNGCSVKDSNTGTNTGFHAHSNGNGHGYSCGNGTSAFHPVGHHHQLSSTQQQPCRTNNYSSNQQHAGSGVPNHTLAYDRSGGHNGTNNAAAAAAAACEGSNGGIGASGTGISTRDEGRSSSDLEGPSPGQQLQRHMQLQQQRQMQLQMQWQQQQQQGGDGGEDDDDDGDDDDDDDMGGEGSEDDHRDAREQQQDSDQAEQLQAIMAQLHGACGNPLMLQQVYGAAAAAAATAQQMMTSAMHGNSSHAASNAGAQRLAAVLQQHLQRAQGGACSSAAAAPVSQGFAPWHGSDSAFAFGSSGSFATGGLLQQQLAGSSSAGPSPAQQQQALQLQAAAGLMGLASSWDAGSAAAGGVTGELSNAGALCGAYPQQLPAHHYHQHHHYHNQQQHGQAAQRQQQRGSAVGELGASISAAAAAAAGLQQLQQGLGGK